MLTKSTWLGFALFGATAIPAAAQEITIPRDGAQLTRIHVNFRWEPFANLASNYELQVVRDNGNFNPFNGFPVMFHDVPAAEPRTVVTEGLEFGRPYAWRVVAFVGNPPVRVASPTYRFDVEPLPVEAPVVTVTTPPGAGPVEPGLVMFSNRQGPASTFTGTLLFTVDETGKIVHYMRPPDAPRLGDLRMLEGGHRNGRLLWIQPSAVLLGGGGRGYEGSIDGQWIWRSPDAVSPSGYDPLSAHHEIFPMPNGDILAMVQDDRTLMINGMPRDYAGDAIVQFDRHTRDVVWEWSVFDDYSPRDLQMAFGPDDWTHGNAVVYDPVRNLVISSMRHLSRITAVDYATRQVAWNCGEQGFPGGDVLFGDNLFSFQHAPEVLDNGNLIVFDNGNNIEPLSNPRQSRAIELAFDDPDNPTTASIAWEYDPVDDQGLPVFTPFVGDADRLPGGHSLVTLGSAGTVDEVDANGALLSRLQIGVGWPTNLVYRAEKVSQLVEEATGDSDGDWDLDMRDFARMQAEYTGAGPAGLSFPVTLLDHDGDDDIDPVDVALFRRWQSGPGR